MNFLSPFARAAHRIRATELPSSSHPVFAMRTLLVSAVRLLTASAVAIVFSLRVQAQGAPTVADVAWGNVLSLARPATPPTSTGKKTLAQVEAERAQQAAQFRQAATAAKNFYIANPTHKKVAEAKKLEASLGLQGVRDDNAAHEAAALEVASAYRQSAANTIADRVEIAALAERVQSRAKLGGKIFGTGPAELEKIAGKLRTEFGDVAPVFDFYADVARGADMVTAKRIATSLSAWPAGPRAKADAQAILARDALIGRPLAGTLTAIDGPPINLAQQKDRLTVIYVWGASNPRGMAPLASYRKSIPAGTQLLYLAIGGTAEQARIAAASAPVPGVTCYEARGANGPTTAQLRILRAPYVYVLDRAGLVAGCGPLAELPNLIAAASR
jgi:hypothetical protein